MAAFPPNPVSLNTVNALVSVIHCQSVWYKWSFKYNSNSVGHNEIRQYYVEKHTYLHKYSTSDFKLQKSFIFLRETLKTFSMHPCYSLYE